MSAQMPLVNMADYEESNLIPAKTKLPMALLDYEVVDKRNEGRLGLKMTFVVTGPEYNNNKIFEYQNLQFPKPEVVKMSIAWMKKFAKAIGMDPNAQLTEELLAQMVGKQFLGTIGISVDKSGQYDDSNTVQKCEPLQSVQHAPAQQQAAQAPAQQQVNQQVAQQKAPAYNPPAGTTAPPAAPNGQGEDLPWNKG